MARVKLLLFGAPRVLLENQPVHVSRRKALALLVYLVMQGKPQSRETLGAMFWPESPDSRNQVRVALSLLRKLLGSEWFSDYGEMVSLETSRDVWVDVLDFRARSNTSTRDSDCVARLTEAMALVQGGFLAGFTLRGCPEFDDWQQLEGLVLEREIERTLRRLIACLEAQGDMDQAIHFGNLLLFRDDLNESTYRLLMRLYAQKGQLHEVRRVYSACFDRLQANLGIRPSKETEALHRQIGEGKLIRETAVPQVPVSRPQTTIPYYGQPFFGRQEEQKQVIRLLEQSECRLLTILGTGGIGKTHLVAKVSEYIPDLFDDGIYFIALDSLTDGEQLLLTLANAMPIHLLPEATVRTQILAQLKDQCLLLILDNLEHLLPEVNPLIADLLDHTSRVKVLATSRVRLGLHGEHVVPLGGLNYPAQDQQLLTVQDAKVFHSVQLFVHWAQKKNVNFELTPDNVEDVAALCATLQGIPLAIRLAAAWCELLGVHELLTQVRASFDLLQDELDDVPQRHSGARALFNSVWEQLDATDRKAFLGLSVFRGGFIREAACDVANVAPNRLKSLLDKSLLTTSAQGGGRYHIHSILRFFASEKLRTADIDRDRLYRRYVAFYAGFLRERTIELRGDDQIAALAEIDQEYPNMQHAWLLCLEHQLYEAAESMIEGLSQYLKLRGYWNDGQRLFAQALLGLEHSDDPSCQRLKNKLSARFYRTSYSQLSDTTTMTSTAQRYGDQPEVAYLTLEIGHMLRYLGHFPVAKVYFSRALRLYEEMSDDYNVASTLQAIACCMMLSDELKLAHDYVQRSLEIKQRIGDQFGMAAARNLVAELALMEGELQLAIHHLQFTYHLCKTYFGENTAFVQVRLLPWCYFFEGELDQSEYLADRLLLATDEDNAVGDRALALRLLAMIACIRKNTEKSQALMRQSEILLAADDFMTMRTRLSLDHQLHLLSECAAAIVFCLNREFDRSKSITVRLLGLKMTHVRPFIINLLFTIDVLALCLQGKQPTAVALKDWMEEQKWLRHISRS